MYLELPPPKTTLNFLPLKHDGGSWMFTEDHGTAYRIQGGSPTLSKRVTANHHSPQPCWDFDLRVISSAGTCHPRLQRTREHFDNKGLQTVFQK